VKQRRGMRRGRNGWERDGAWQCGAGQKEVGGEEEVTAGGANGGKGTTWREGAGSRRGWNKRARDAARRGGTGRNGSEGIAEETVGGAKWGEGGTRKGKLRYCVGEGTG